MADILLLCPDCKYEQTVSEYVNPEGVMCARCETPLEVPSADKNDTLAMKSPETFRNTPSDQKPINTLPDELIHTESVGATLEEVYQPTSEVVKGPKAFFGWLAFVAVLAGLVFCQLAVQSDHSMLSGYNWVRGVVAGIIFLLVVVVAFEDHVWQGVLTLVIPPYALYYAMFRLDSYVLRSLFLAVLASFCAELYLLPKDAAFMYAQTSLNSFIHDIDSMIQRAGDAPVFN